MIRYWFPKPYADAVQRLRVPAGFVLLVAFALLSRPSKRSLAQSIPVSAAGLALRGWAAGHLAKNEALATSGPYAHVRNPLYLGTLATAAGIVVASRSRALALIFTTVFLGVYLPAVELEEQHLRAIFPGYQAYADRVPRFLFTLNARANGRSFSPALYRKNQEWKAAGGYLIALTWLIGKTRFL